MKKGLCEKSLILSKVELEDIKSDLIYRSLRLSLNIATTNATTLIRL